MGSEALLEIGSWSTPVACPNVAAMPGGVCPGLDLSGLTLPPADQATSGHVNPDGSITHQFEIVLLDPTTGDGLSYALIPTDTTPLDSVRLIGGPGACIAATSSQCVVTMPTTLELVVRTTQGDGVLGTITPAAYSPTASVFGDPWFRFGVRFRADTRLVLTNKAGTVTKRIGFGWLARGKHSLHFRCTAGAVRYVHVVGAAADGVRQVSPVRKVVC
jgi:hypothetical protein